MWFWLLWWRKAGIAGREGAFLGSLGCGGFCGVSGLGFGGALGPVSGGAGAKLSGTGLRSGAGGVTLSSSPGGRHLYPAARRFS